MLRDLFSLFPAYAGVIPTQTIEQATQRTFPRIRGGDPYIKTGGRSHFLFSPHTRG